MNRLTAPILCLSFFSLLGGCAMHREPVWGQAGLDQPTKNTGILFAAARECFDTAAGGAAVDACIALHEKVLRDNPGHYQARVNAASLYILKGTGYTDSSSEKTDAFYKAMTYAELAMYTNPSFKTRVDSGAQPWEAADSLGAAEKEAMYFWVTALQYEFKEGMSLPSKIVNIDWLQHALVFLDRVETVAPDYGGGGVEFAKVICYVALPESRGGSDAKGDEYMQKSIARGSNWLLPRWARGKYYQPMKGDSEAAKADLSWVAAQNPATFSDPLPWRVHFQEDSLRLLR